MRLVIPTLGVLALLFPTPPVTMHMATRRFS